MKNSDTIKALVVAIEEKDQPDKNAVGTARQPGSTDIRVQTNSKRADKEIRELRETPRNSIQTQSQIANKYGYVRTRTLS